MNEEENRKYVFAQLNSLPNTFQYVEVTQYIKNIEQENQQLKEEINKISKKELKIMQMLRSIELCTLTKERIDQIEEVMFELGCNNE